MAADYIRSVRFLKTNFAYNLKGAPDGLPVPPVRLISLVTGKPDKALYFETGLRASISIHDTLAKQKLFPENMSAILDFGCGCGRVARYWQTLRSGIVHGVDYNERLVKWCQQNLAFGIFRVNQITPPLDFEPNHFYLVYALSVFTHLTPDLQISWMKELHRVLLPGGHLLITTHGRYYWEQLSNSDREKFQSGQLVVVTHGPIGPNRVGAYHPKEYVCGTFSNGFKLMDFVPEGAKGNPFQDLYLFRKNQTT